MIIVYIASLIILGLLISRQIKRPNKTYRKNQELFWRKESASNATRKKSLEALSFVNIPLEEFPLDVLKDNEVALGLQSTLIELGNAKILNLTGISNTDLKLKHGTANITVLSEYDANYTLLARTLQSYGALLYQEQYRAEALIILEFAITTNTDVSGTYKLLTTIYIEDNRPDKIKLLITQAQQLSSLTKNQILRALQEAYQYND